MTNDRRLIEVEVEVDGERLDRFLADRLELSRSRIEKLIDAGEITVDGQSARKRDLTRTGQLIQVALPAPVPSHALPENLPLHIVYEDADLLVIDKAAGVVVHPAPGNRTGTLVNALLHHVDDLSGIGGVMRPGIVHRLDRDTSGLLIVAKNDRSHELLSAALKRRKIRRRYLTACWGHLNEDSETVDAPIARHPGERKKMGIVEGGRRAVTHFRRLERWTAGDLLSAELETGRTHQIRVHLLHIGHPVIGDRSYAEGREKGFSGRSRQWAQAFARRVPRQFLHATELQFTHPVTEAELRFESPLPPDLAAAADWARQQT